LVVATLCWNAVGGRMASASISASRSSASAEVEVVIAIPAG
jgi:hypothetical protein